MADKVRAFGSLLGTGLASGALGGLVGLGAHGSPIMVPALKSMAKHSTATATGTAAVAVVSTGLAGCLGFATAGSFEPSKGMFGKIEVFTAVMTGVGAAIGSRIGTPLASKLNPQLLQRSFGVVQLVLAPLVLYKPIYDKRVKEEAEQRKKLLRKSTTVISWGKTYTDAYTTVGRFAEAAGRSPPIGLAAGTIFGVLGVGGGVVIAPCLCLLTNLDHATVLGTTLAAMLPASAITALSHWRAGSVCMYSAVPLVLATAAGGYYGSKLAVDLPEEQTKTLFAATIFGLGVRRLML